MAEAATGRASGRLRIAVLPGDGIGPEVTAAAVEVLAAACAIGGLALEAEVVPFGGAAIDACGLPLPEATLAAARSSQGVLLGAVGGARWDDAPVRPEQGLLALRQRLGVFANLRPVRVLRGMEDISPVRRAAGMDLVIVRELTGGLYFGAREEGEDRASDQCVYTRGEIERVVRLAFSLARGRSGRLVSVDKANVLATSRLWRQVVNGLAAQEPGVSVEHLLVDAMAMHLVTDPCRFDVVVTENLFGDVLSDEAGAVAGSIGLAASASLGAPGAPGIFEPIHGSAPDIAGQGIANPAGAMLSAALLLRHGAARSDLAECIEEAVEGVIADGVRTRDLGGEATTEAFTQAVLGALRG